MGLIERTLSKEKTSISVVIPVYGCPEALPELHERLTKTLNKIAGNDYEIILVNDACPKNSWQVVENLCNEDPHVTGLELSRNFGQIRAILAGLDYCKGEWVVVMDCDLQDQPEEIIRMYQKVNDENLDTVFARRVARKDGKGKIFLAKRFYNLYSWATGIKYDPSLCNFSMSNRKVIDAYCSMREIHRAFIMYIQWMGFREGTIDVDHHARFAGKSGYTLKKRIDFALEILTSQSDKLLRVMMKTGIGISMLSFIAVIVTVVKHFVTSVPVGWSSLIAVIFFSTGLLLTALGVIGIYIGNIFMQVKDRPLYIIRTVLNNKSSKEKPSSK
jgi:dolichol-phosphate mannosyltransferase